MKITLDKPFVVCYNNYTETVKRDMNMFTPSKFEDCGEYVFYNHGGPGTCHFRNERKFVARFKRGGKASFIKFLKANFTPDEYFARIFKGETPLGILNAKGYVSPMMKKMKKRENRG